MQFVTSKDRPTDGAAKLIERGEAESVVEYFIAPGVPNERRTVATQSLEPFRLEPQERVYFEDGHLWRVGRFDGFSNPDDRTQVDVVLPNVKDVTLPIDDVYIRSSIPLEDPLPLLQSRNTETPFWHDRRAAFLRNLHKQRSVYRGLTALASSNVEIVQHQLTVVRKVLNDPNTRYLLADEVGLGKTIEAGIIIRQYVLDHPNHARIQVLAPNHLVAQWQQELLQLFRIAFSTVDLEILNHQQGDELSTVDPAHTLLIVDEAHLLAQHAYGTGRHADLYHHVRERSTRVNGVLLLSGTPIVHNEDAFLAMLHLLDPDTYPLTDRTAFRQRIANREVIAYALQDLTDDAGPTIIEPSLNDLEPLANTNEFLSQRIQAVRSLLRSNDDTERTETIRRLRTYLHSTYRLDRRMLRTRRRRDHVKVHLGQRQCEPWLIDDPDRANIYEWLDGWRRNAPSSTKCKKVFSTMLNAAMRHPSLLEEVINRRRENLDHGRQSYFDNEKDYLARAQFTTDIAHDVRLKALVELLVKHRYKQKYLVFISDPSIASQVTDYLRDSNLIVSHLGAAGNPLDKVERFLTNRNYSALICDEDSETGLNIQRPGTKVTAIHFDIPLFANRIEQRVGRLDRIHGDRIVKSLVPLWPTDSYGNNYEHAWTQCLIDAVGVFDRSVATLQHALDAGHQQLTKTILAEGIEAIDHLAKRWKDANDPDSLVAELKRIESQEGIDELVAETDHAVFHQTVDDYEYDDDKIKGFQTSVREWASDCLGFKQRACPNKDDTCQGAVAYEYHNRTTLLPQRTFIESFPSMSQASRFFRGITTDWMHFDRDDAAERRIPIARIGHPFITDLQTQITHDDRGRVFAYWKTIRAHPDHALHATPELYFRFDFLVESDPAVVETLIASQQLSPSALRRRIDSVFPPRFITKWIDVEGREVTDENYIGVLKKPYGCGDTNLHEHHWADIDRLTLFGDWNGVCNATYQTAAQLIDEDPELRRETTVARTTLTTQFQETRDELLARIETTQNDSDAARLTLETDLHNALTTAVATPRVRIDAVGAIFLATKPLAEYLPDDNL
jgi:ATP-dependent helicase HepA